MSSETTKTAAPVFGNEELIEWCARVRVEKLELPPMVWVGLSTWQQILTTAIGNISPLRYADGRFYVLTAELKRFAECPEGGVFDAPRVYSAAAQRENTGWRRL